MCGQLFLRNDHRQCPKGMEKIVRISCCEHVHTYSYRCEVPRDTAWCTVGNAVVDNPPTLNGLEENVEMCYSPSQMCMPQVVLLPLVRRFQYKINNSTVSLCA